ncbi:MAG TPA: hypothetical protein VMT57_06710 [Candidatus Thermoplasmatota archaeon]|nr:hypothetical protein [Candidatus Thermoplasmatota archaeon]
MQTKIMKREAAVLLLTGLMVFSSVAVLANTNQKPLTSSTTEVGLASSSPKTSDLVWDNYMGTKAGVLAAQFYPGTGNLDAFPADDFKLTATYDVKSVSWQGGYYNCQYASGAHDYGFPWNITFFNNNATGNKPGTVYAKYSFQNASITHSFWWTSNVTTRWYANYSVTLSPPVRILANTEYWICIYAYNKTFPQAGWSRHNASVGGPVKLHEGMFKSVYFGYPDWVNASKLLNNVPHDFNFALGGTIAAAPVLEIQSIKGPIGVTATIKNTGDANASNVKWNIAFTGGTILIGKAKNNTIPTIAASAEGKAKIPFVLGFGKSVIGVQVSCDEGATANKSQNATVFLILVLTK